MSVTLRIVLNLIELRGSETAGSPKQTQRLARLRIERRVNHIFCCASSPVLCRTYVNAQVVYSGVCARHHLRMRISSIIVCVHIILVLSEFHMYTC